MSRRKNPAGIPATVERYFAETKEKQPGIADNKAWAIAWSRYCKYKRPGSPRCHLDRSDYFPGAAMPNPAGRVPLARITLVKGEGKEPPEGREVKLEAGSTPNLWRAADRTLWHWSMFSPEPGAYDKTTVVLVWENGQTFVDRIDLNRAWGTARRTLSDHVQHVISMVAGLGGPAHFTPEQYAGLLSLDTPKGLQVAHQFEEMWKHLDLGDAPYETGPVLPPGRNAPGLEARRLAELLTSTGWGEAQVVSASSPLAAVVPHGSVVLYPRDRTFDPIAKRRLDVILGQPRFAAVTDEALLVAPARVDRSLAAVLDARQRWGAQLGTDYSQRHPEPAPAEPQVAIPETAKEQIAAIRSFIRAVVPSVSVTMGKGTSYGWVNIWSKGDKFTAEERQGLEAMGLSPGGNFANIAAQDRKALLRRWMAQSRPRIPTKAELARTIAAPEHKPGETLPELVFGGQYENKWWRIRRMSNIFEITELANAGKRGKEVRQLTLHAQSHQHGATTDEAARELVEAAQSPYIERMRSYARRVTSMVPGYELTEHNLKGIDVVPYAAQYEAQGLDFGIRVTPREFSVRGHDVNGCSFYALSVTDARKAHPYLMSIRDRVGGMTYKEISKAVSELGVRTHHYCAVD